MLICPPRLKRLTLLRLVLGGWSSGGVDIFGALLFVGVRAADVSERCVLCIWRL